MTLRPIPKDRLIIATHNAGKVREFEAMLAGHVAHVVTAGSLGLPEPEETEATFTGNAALKARAAASAAKGMALADDSGLCVNALGGQPGVYSARWAGPEKDFRLAMQKVHQMLGGAADRSAYFISVLALAWPDGHVEFFEGRTEGHIVWPPHGDKGFGYDPIFMPAGHDRTFAEMDREEKNALSHRGIAVRKFVERVRRS
jgi:XTP/dITP diphosphohydrolase